MRGVDTGLLLCAINRFDPGHSRAATAVETLASGDRPWAVPLTVLHEFLRLATHPHVTSRALSPALALAFLDQLLASPSAQLLRPTPAHRSAIADVVAMLAPDRTLPAGFDTAVLLREHDVRELLSADSGMRRFPFLSVRDPLHGPPWTPDEPPARRYRRLARTVPPERPGNAARPRERRSP